METKFSKPEIKALPRKSNDLRIGHILPTKRSAEARCTILGFPSDEGVRRNSGRAGAKKAPDKIREALFKLTPDVRNCEKFSDLISHTEDLGNLTLGSGLEEEQAKLGKIVSELLSKDSIAIVLGGGHETSYGHFLGYVEARRELQILNFDAHLDVREIIDGKGTSGTPFRQALEHPKRVCKSYSVVGAQPHSVSKSHYDYVMGKGGAVYFQDEVSILRIDQLFDSLTHSAMVSFDLDSVDGAHAPGASSPNPHGIELSLWFHAAYRAGRSPKVCSFDLVEYNPDHDVDNRTARVAALTIWHFFRGLAERL